ncbi:hypothetical protein CROQUDRAFT_696135, partial [Cronartium quercuum f. sp. fusiforme G11]
LGPFLFSPTSEVYGRSLIFRIGCTLFLLFNLACGFSRTHLHLGVFRLCAGFFAGGPLGISQAVLAEMWGDERGRPMGLNSLAAVAGPCMGTAIGYLIKNTVSWQMLFWVTSAIGWGSIFMMSVFIPETYSLVDKNRNSLEKEEINDGADENLSELSIHFSSAEDVIDMDQSTMQMLLYALLRPVKIAINEPVAIVIGFDKQKDTKMNGLHCIYMTLGALISSKANTDWLSKLCDSFGIKNPLAKDRPEYKLRCMIPGTIILAVGSVMFAFARHFQAPIAILDISLLLLGGATILSTRKTTTYIIDVYKDHAASALVVSTSFQRLASFFVPLIVNLTRTPKPSTKMEQFLPLMVLVFVIPTPWILFQHQSKAEKRKILGSKV